MPQIPTVPLKTIVLFHLFLFTAAMWVSPLSASWLWTNVFVLLLMLRLLEIPPTATEPSTQIAEVCVCLYALTIVNDIICFSITDAGLSPGQTFSLTMACFSMAAKPFFGTRAGSSHHTQLFSVSLKVAAALVARAMASSSAQPHTRYSFVAAYNHSAITATGYEESWRDPWWVHGRAAGWWARRSILRIYSTDGGGRSKPKPSICKLWNSTRWSRQHHGVTSCVQKSIDFGFWARTLADRKWFCACISAEAPQAQRSSGVHMGCAPPVVLLWHKSTTRRACA